MSAETYHSHLKEEAAALDHAIRKAEAEYNVAEIHRRVELAGTLAVLQHRRERIAAKLVQAGSDHGLLQNVRAELDQDLAAFADFLERQIASY